MKSILRFFFSGQPLSAGWQDFGLGTTRIFLGLSMALAHGWGKMPPPERFVSMLGGMGFPAPGVFAWLAGLSEFAGGLLLALGLFTRFSAVSIIITMGVAAFMAHASDDYSTKEMSLLYFFSVLPFFFVGAGRFSVDGLLKR